MANSRDNNNNNNNNNNHVTESYEQNNETNIPAALVDTKMQYHAFQANFKMNDMNMYCGNAYMHAGISILSQAKTVLLMLRMNHIFPYSFTYVLIYLRKGGYVLVNYEVGIDDRKLGFAIWVSVDAIKRNYLRDIKRPDFRLAMPGREVGI
uniref:Uncharacterized protein n=1 Tax=Glossina austeni TaxID=7395 RepID=A0A1A9V761_GLOAU